MLTFDIVRAIVAEAHEHDLRVTAHVGESRGARLALRAGVQELERLAGSWLGRLGALRAATSRAATVLAVDGLGRLAEGSPADLAAVRGDPTRDFAVLRDPILLVRGGRVRLGG